MLIDYSFLFVILMRINGERLVFLARDGLCEASNSEVASKKEHVTPILLKCVGKHPTRDLPKFIAGSKP
ncbi:hypothetical protein QVD17_28073 [Tagetes erecta]|uniref:Uncharacterized protein n=1 Tax=Tagetes erecta TaxID=13708 RepID=A0AAD8NK59_TARER|nr:hypothetical protein QVD17_28073 [Tagetes erecta]